MNIQKFKLRVAEWLHHKYPGKYCWADCVAYSYSPKRINPFKIESSKGCKIESITHDQKLCYCGGWQNGKCFDLLPQEEKDKYINETKEAATLEPPF